MAFSEGWMGSLGDGGSSPVIQEELRVEPPLLHITKRLRLSLTGKGVSGGYV